MMVMGDRIEARPLLRRMGIEEKEKEGEKKTLSFLSALPQTSFNRIDVSTSNN